MDHSESVGLKAVEKYALGELSPEVREEFEEHYFDCAECAADVRAMVTFTSASRMILAEEAAEKNLARERREKGRGWFAWLRGAVAVPAMAALAAVVIFQAVVTIPRLREQAAGQTGAQVFESSFRIQGATRGENTSRVAVRTGESFALDFDFTPSVSFAGYTGELVDSSGKTLLSFALKGEEANKEVHVVVPGDKVQAGNYELVILGERGTSDSQGKKNEVQRLSFAVETRP